jgi:hypothetical protein
LVKVEQKATKETKKAFGWQRTAGPSVPSNAESHADAPSAERRRFGQAFGSYASLPSFASVHDLFAPVIGDNDTSPRVDPRARRLVDP